MTVYLDLKLSVVICDLLLLHKKLNAYPLAFYFTDESVENVINMPSMCCRSFNVRTAKFVGERLTFFVRYLTLVVAQTWKK